MDLRHLPAPGSERRFGRRASDGETQARHHTAAFVAQVAGLSLPGRDGLGGYSASALSPPPGLVTNLKA